MTRLPAALLSSLAAVWNGPSWAAAFDEAFPAGDRGFVEIAAIDDALTFARTMTGGAPHVLAVTSYRAGVVDAVDLTLALASHEDVAAMFLARGYDTLRDTIRDAPPDARVRVPVSSLVLPMDFDEHHVAVGTNYPEHASDAGTTRPFLFPKIVEPTPSGSDVAVHGGLLDYEVEIAVLALEPIADPSPRYLGVLLANDFTDREALMRVVDRNDIESGKGFTTGKSFPGYLPLGNLLVVPRDWSSFVRRLELRLYVNDRLRQRAPATEMVWDVREVLSQTLARKDVRWEHRGRDVPMFGGSGEAIPAGTLVLTGTPHGTVFAGVPARTMAEGVGRWLAGGWSRSVPDNVIDAYVESARAAHAYLQPGDRVHIHVHGLGEIVNRVVP